MAEQEQLPKTGTEWLEKMGVRRHYPPQNQQARVVPRPVLLGAPGEKKEDKEPKEKATPAPEAPKPKPAVVAKPALSTFVVDAIVVNKDSVATPRRISLREIKEAGVEFLKDKGITVALLEGPRRSQNISKPRQILMYFSYMCGKGYSMPQVGKHYGGRDHSTVGHGLNQIVEIRANGPRTIHDEAGLELLNQLCQHFGVPLESLKAPDNKSETPEAP